MYTFLNSGITLVNNMLRKRLDFNFSNLQDRLNQLLHGGSYAMAADTTTTISVTNTWYPVTGVLAAVGTNYGFDEDATSWILTHAHGEPSGTFHFYDICGNIRVYRGGATTVGARLRWYDSSEGTTSTIWEAESDLIKTPGSNYYGYFNMTTRAALTTGDTLTLEIRNTTNTGNLSIGGGGALVVKGT